MYHLKCTGLKALPEGEWFCPAPGCLHSRGSIIPLPQAVEGAGRCAHRWEAMPPLRVGKKLYQRVRCDGERVYYALTPLARDLTGLAGKELADMVRGVVGYPDRVYVRESVFPHDVARLRELGMMNANTRNRAFVTAEALLGGIDEVASPLAVQQRMAWLREALEADRQQQQEQQLDEAEALAAEKQPDDDDLDEELACAPHPLLVQMADLQKGITQLSAVVGSLQSELESLTKSVEAKIALAAAQQQPQQQPQQQQQQPQLW